MQPQVYKPCLSLFLPRVEFKVLDESLSPCCNLWPQINVFFSFSLSPLTILGKDISRILPQEIIFILSNSNFIDPLGAYHLT